MFLCVNSTFFFLQTQLLLKKYIENTPSCSSEAEVNTALFSNISTGMSPMTPIY